MNEGAFERVETNEIRWSGRLSAEKFGAAILNAVCEEVGASRRTSGLSLSFTVKGDPTAPEVHFVLVEDRHWYLKKEGDLAINGEIA